MVRKVYDYGKNLLFDEHSSSLKVSFVIMGISLLTKVLGIVTRSLVANRIGLNRDLDIFFAANIIPEMLANIFLFGALGAAVVPILSLARKEKGDLGANKVLSIAITFSVIAFTLLALLSGIFADKLLPFAIENILRPTTPFSAFELSRISSIMRLMLFSQVLIGIGSFLSVGLQSIKRFIVPQLTGLFYGIGQIIGILFFMPLFQDKVNGWIVGIFIGSFLHVLIQLPLVIKMGIHIKIDFDFTNVYLRKMVLLGIPRIFSVATNQLAEVVDKLIALQLSAGSLSALVFALSIVTTVEMLVGYSFSSVVFPQLSDYFARNQIKEAKDLFIKVFNQILFFLVPITMIFIVLRVPIVRIFYGIYPNGEFSWDSTRLVAYIILLFSFGLIPDILSGLLKKLFFAKQNTIIPTIVSIFVVIGGIATGILFSNYLKHFDTTTITEITFNLDFFRYNAGSSGIAAVGGLALSSSLISILSFIVLIFITHFKVFKLGFEEFWLKFISKLSVGFSMFTAMYLISKVWEYSLNTEKVFGVILLTGGTILTGIVVYIVLGMILNIEEVDIVKRGFRKAFKFVTST